MFFHRKLKKWNIEIPNELDELIKKYKEVEKKNFLKSDIRHDIKIVPKRKRENREVEEKSYVLSSSYVMEEQMPYEIEKEIREVTRTETFQELLFKYIDERGLQDKDVYKKAYIDRKLFSKIRCDNKYHPSFGTVTLLGLSLKLSIKEFEKLLEAAYYSLPKNSEEKIVIRYLFEHKIYDVQIANNILYTVCGKTFDKMSL